MDSNAVFGVIEDIASNPSKNAKESLVKTYSQDADFVKVLEYTYNPFKTFGIIPSKPLTVGNEPFNDGTWQLLDKLIKRELTGNEARSLVQNEFNRLGEKSADLLWRIMKKDLRAGFSESTINKAIKGLIPDFPYMRCSLPKDVKLETFDWNTGVFSQEKADGMFVNINNDTTVSLNSRQGSPFPTEQFGHLLKEIAETLLPNTQSHGEFLIKRDGKVLPREIGNGILNSVLKGGTFDAGDIPTISIWDQIPLSEVKTKGKYNAPYTTRYHSLETQLTNSKLLNLIDTRIVHSIDEAYTHYREMLSKGKEGTILKNPTAIWKDSTSKEQVKLKLEITVDLEVVAFLVGNGKNSNTFGSILCKTSDELLEVAVSGYTDKQRLALWNDKDNIIGKIMAVKSNAIMTPSGNGKHSLFLPRCVECPRLDKNIADSLEDVKSQFESAIK